VIAQAWAIDRVSFKRQLLREAVIMLCLYVYHTGQYRGQPIK